MISLSERRNLETAIQCLELAVHPNTGEGEAAASLTAWRRKVNGMPLEEVCRQIFDKHYALGTTLLEYEIEWKANFEAKQQRIQDLLGETIDLKRELAATKKALEHVSKQHATLSGLFRKKGAVKPSKTGELSALGKAAMQQEQSKGYGSTPAKPEPAKPEPPKPEVRVEPPKQEPRSAADNTPKQPKIEWSDEDTAYLISVHLEDQTRSNPSLAKMCEQYFGREITENSIRGALNRLRKKGRVPRYRPGRERKPKDAA